MNAEQPKERRTNQTPQKVPDGTSAHANSQDKEPTLVNLYRELTGKDESQARSTFMHVVRDDEEFGARPKH